MAAACIARIGRSWVSDPFGCSLFACWLLGGALLGCSTRQPEASPKSPATAASRPAAEAKGSPCEQLDPLIRPLVEANWMPSVSLAWLDGERRSFCSFGHADSNGTPATPDTLYEIGSLTKLFTGVLLASMIIENGVRLEEPVLELLLPGTAIPSFDGHAISLLHLATHRSGLPRMPTNVGRWEPDDPFGKYDDFRLFQFLASARLSAPPGSEYIYSNLGAALLGQALAARARKPYEELIDSRVLEPLGMRDTYFAVPAAARARVATGHDAEGTPRQMWTFKAFAPAGALRSTARDMARFAAAALRTTRDRLGQAMKLAKMPRAEAAAGRHIGLFFQTRPDGVHWHNGSTGGYSSYMAIDPSRELGLVMLTSSTSILTDALGDKILEFQRGAPLSPFDLPDDLALAPAELAEYAGTYRVSEDLVVRVFLRDDALYAQTTGAEAFRLWPSKRDRFYFRVAEANIDFERRADRKISAMVLDQGDSRQRATRLLP